MANKKTIHQLEGELELLHRKLSAVVRKINERRELIKKIRRGQVKQPPPPGVKVTIGKPVRFTHEDFNDVIPSFGPAGR